MKKNGFTLVELLAVIFILALLVIITLPNIIKLYNQSKERTFNSEVEIVKTELEKETYKYQLNGQNIPEIYSSFGENKLDMVGKELEYYAEMNSDGTIKYLEITDGQFYYQYKGDGTSSGVVVDLEEDNPIIKMDYIKDNVSTGQIFVYDTEYEIYDSTNAVPIIMTNMSENDIKVIASYKGIVLKEFTIKPKTEDNIEFVYLSQETINTLKENEKNSLKIDTEVNLGMDLNNEDIIVKYPYSNKIKFTKVNPDMIITNATSSTNAKIAFNQTGIFIPKNTSVGTLNVYVKNNSNSTYKFKNIFRDELKMKENNINEKVYTPIIIEGTELEKYQGYLNGGIYFYNKSTNKFTMDFASKTNIQKIYFDFDVFINPGVYNNGNITISSKENSSLTNYGDFKPIDSSYDNQHGTGYCSYTECFGDKKLEYDTLGEGLYFGVGKETLVLDIAQSMSVKDTYSVYLTVDGLVSQEGEPGKSFPATIIAISQENMKYLSWIGFYKNYMHVYSYYQGESYGNLNYELTNQGFISFNISKYAGKKMNIQVTAKRGGNTKVYINGELVKSFSSGKNPVDYKMATIGDLRPTRGLKFTGKLYDLALYNTELSSDAVKHNWNYAKSKWNIN
ncbi:MAG: prepilin-type N-terminal cleavage/methylation domain-containing protein [bacterium]|nr:prepilin-type N-terminal cleavage/methylation domain-containing protein [bacterium]